MHQAGLQFRNPESRKPESFMNGKVFLPFALEGNITFIILDNMHISDENILIFQGCLLYTNPCKGRIKQRIISTSHKM